MIIRYLHSRLLLLYQINDVFEMNTINTIQAPDANGLHKRPCAFVVPSRHSELSAVRKPVG